MDIRQRDCRTLRACRTAVVCSRVPAPADILTSRTQRLACDIRHHHFTVLKHHASRCLPRQVGAPASRRRRGSLVRTNTRHRTMGDAGCLLVRHRHAHGAIFAWHCAPAAWQRLIAPRAWTTPLTLPLYWRRTPLAQRLDTRLSHHLHTAPLPTTHLPPPHTHTAHLPHTAHLSHTHTHHCAPCLFAMPSYIYPACPALYKTTTLSPFLHAAAPVPLLLTMYRLPSTTSTFTHTMPHLHIHMAPGTSTPHSALPCTQTSLPVPQCPAIPFTPPYLCCTSSLHVALCKHYHFTATCLSLPSTATPFTH